MKHRILLCLLFLTPFAAHAACELRADTAADVLLGPFVDKTDGVTFEESLTLTQAEIQLSKNGQALAQKNDATSAVFDNFGNYNVELDTTDTNTEGMLQIRVEDAANLSGRVWLDCLVLGAAEHDRKYGVTAQLTALDGGMVEGPTTIATLATQLSFTIATGATNDDAYNDHTICFIGGAEKDCTEIDDYTGSSKTVTLLAAAAVDFTLQTTDIVRIFRPGMVVKIDAIKTKTDQLTFTVANEVDANTQTINDCTVTGDGNATPFDSGC